LEVGGRRSGARDQRSEVGGRRTEVGGEGDFLGFRGYLGEQPCLVGFGDGSGFESDDFRHIVGMGLCESALERAECGSAGFENGEHFGGGFDPPLPAVNRLHGRNEIDASRELLFHQRCANLSRQGRLGKRAEHDKHLVHAVI